MAEQTFRSPGFFEQEIDLSARVSTPLGVPAGIVGTSGQGPAFVPVTVGSLADFTARFGSLDQDQFGPYAVREFLKNRNAVTFVRVLGAGVIEDSGDVTNAELGGFVKNAGLKLKSSALATAGRVGALTLICAQHDPRSNETVSELAGFPVFTDNDSFQMAGGDDRPGADGEFVHLVRAAILVASGTHIIPLDGDGVDAYTDGDHNTAGLQTLARSCEPSDGTGSKLALGRFKLVVATPAQFDDTADASIDESARLHKTYEVSLNPNDSKYISNVMNTDPDQFQSLGHLLYLDYAVEHELAPVRIAAGTVSVVTGRDDVTSSSSYSPENMIDALGRLDARFTTPVTPSIISQPFGETEYDLFHFETISDGESANNEYKISIANVRRSIDPNNPFGTFDVQVRKFDDTDTSLEIVEAFPACTLDPTSEDYVARKIGDKKVFYNFNAADEDDRGLAIRGKHPNRSSRIRIQMATAVERKEIPAESLPFGFRGIPVLKTCDSLNDKAAVTGTPFDGTGNVVTAATTRLMGDNDVATSIAGSVFSIVPPLPLRFKCTRGAVSSSPTFIGTPGENERSDSRLYWGVKFERMPLSSSADQGSVTDAIMNVNASGLANPLVSAYSKFQGIAKLDNLVTGSGADLFNNNKFTLARVALKEVVSAGSVTTNVTSTAKEHMLSAAYIRNGIPDSSDYSITDAGNSSVRVTLASLVNDTNAASIFNRFSEYAKFTTMFYGGWDGVNLLDRDSRLMNDRASSSDTGGRAGDSANVGLRTHVAGAGQKNNVVSSFKEAVTIITNPMASRVNILAVPGMRDAFISDHALEAVKSYSMAIYLMDVIKYGRTNAGTVVRMFDDSVEKVDVQETAEQFEGRVIDNNYSAAYFPDVWIRDDLNNTNVKVPASVTALGALAFNDRVAYPWFAPAGFNRGSLENVANVDVRLNSADRDLLYDARLNPIAVFPSGGFVIFGQKTLQVAKSALDRVNVRRLLLEVKRLVSGVATKLLFEQNNDQTRQKFVNQITPLLTLIQAQAGVEKFSVVCDNTNNTEADRESNRMNGRIVLVPTRAVEFIAIDFIVTNSGVSFE